ncbi:MAG: FMN-binding negative transcriptional regulator [Candidatus Contendobacter sp.]|nr:FMN-binding negative transcriptional regulator [Candidatus Contendobacter sp.]MDS4060019.1 FMN-binding negative transcriptional regulator [Candidatus Contendobacter sp.]
MYVPKHFEEHRPEELHRVIREHPLGILILNSADGLDANHIPFALNEENGQAVLLAHVARANPLWREAKDGDEALVIFRAANAYISPNWYPSKHQFHKQVPTWNYQAVHVQGKINIRDDEKFVRAVVARLTRTNETRSGQERPWKMTDSSKDYIDQMINAVVGIEIKIEKIVGKWKLSQNKEGLDRSTAASELQKRGDTLTSSAMLATLKPSA